jgi:DNA polymerase III subunit delta'
MDKSCQTTEVVYPNNGSCLPEQQKLCKMECMKWNIVGHEWAVDLLREHVSHGQQRHAYLFTGPPGIGRRTLALRFSQALNCLQPPEKGGYCGACRSCQRIEKMAHPDLHIIQSQETGGVLKVDEIRELQHSLSLTPYEARFRIALILRFEEANLSTANALLKTLEEPSSRVVMILTADNSEMLLPTIVSRCEILRLRPLSVSILEKGLQEKWGDNLEKVSFLARISNGCPGIAQKYAENPVLLERRESWLTDIRTLISSNRVQRFAFVDKILKENDKEKVREFLNTWQSFWRDVMLFSAGSNSELANPDCIDHIRDLAGLLDLEQARQAVLSIQRTLELIPRNVNLRLALEVMMLDLPKISKSPIIG